MQMEKLEDRVAGSKTSTEVDFTSPFTLASSELETVFFLCRQGPGERGRWLFPLRATLPQAGQ